MVRCLPLVLLMVLTGSPVLAGNARSDRTARTFQRDQARRAYLNAQWARHMAAQRQDQARYRANPTDPAASRTGAMHYWSRKHWQSWQQRTAPRPVIRYRR